MSRNIHTAIIVGPRTPLRQSIAEYFSTVLDAGHLVVCEADAQSLHQALNKKGREQLVFDTVVILTTALDERESEWPAVEIVEAVADGLTWASDASLVVVTSAMVYGAKVAHPIPLTEQARLEPNVDFPFAGRLFALEHRGSEWVRNNRAKQSKAPSVRLAILRPAVVLGDTRRWPDEALVKSLGMPFGEQDPPKQFVHVDDLKGAVVLACEQGLEGTFNVASDGWLSGSEVRALLGMPQNPLLPSRYTNFRQRRASAAMGGLLNYASYPWVVANDRLKATGWRAEFTNEQAFIEVNSGPLWTRLSPKRRQEIALVSTAGTLVGLVVGGVVALRRWWRD